MDADDVQPSATISDCGPWKLWINHQHYLLQLTQNAERPILQTAKGRCRVCCQVILRVQFGILLIGCRWLVFDISRAACYSSHRTTPMSASKWIGDTSSCIVIIPILQLLMAWYGRDSLILYLICLCTVDFTQRSTSSAMPECRQFSSHQIEMNRPRLGQ